MNKLVKNIVESVLDFLHIDVVNCDEEDLTGIWDISYPIYLKLIELVEGLLKNGGELTYRDLFDFLRQSKVGGLLAIRTPTNENRQFKQDSISSCNGKLYFTKVFCVKNGLDFSKIREKLEDTGGYCDCEVLFNSERRINGDIKLLKRGLV